MMKIRFVFNALVNCRFVAFILHTCINLLTRHIFTQLYQKHMSKFALRSFLVYLLYYTYLEYSS